MKKIILLWMFLMGLLLPAHSQITITNSVFPAQGDMLFYAIDNQPNGIVITPPDFNAQQWDFSNLTPSATWSHLIRDPQTGAGKAFFPGATLFYYPEGRFPIRHFPGSNQVEVEAYLKVTNNEVTLLGFFGGDPLGLGLDLVSLYNPPIVLSRAPVQFFDIKQTSSGLLAPFGDQELSPSIRNKLPFTADSFRIRTAVSRLDAVDAFGSLTIPGGTFNVLRQKSTQYRESRIDAKIPPLGWQDVTDIFIQFIGLPTLGVDTLVTYQFLNDQSKEPIAICTTDNTQLRVTSVQYKDVMLENCTAAAQETVIKVGEPAPGCLKDPQVATAQSPDGTGQVSCARIRFDLTGFENAGCTSATMTVAQGCGMGGGKKFVAYYYDAQNDACGAVYGNSDETTGAITIDLTDPVLAANNYTVIVCRPGMGPVNVVNVAFDCQNACTPSISIMTETGQYMICTGGSAKLIAMTTGCTTGLIQWQSSPDGQTFTDIIGQNGTALTVSPSATTYYRATFDCNDSDSCPPATSTPVGITVAADPVVMLTPEQATICVGGSQSFTATVSGGVGCTQATYYIAEEGGDVATEIKTVLSGTALNLPADLPGGSLSPGVYVISALAVCSGSGCSANAALARLTVLPDPTTTLTFGNDQGTATICAGGSMSLKYSATLPDGSGCTWTLTQDGGGTIASGNASTGGVQTVAIPGVSTLEPGAYTFRLSVSCTTGGCNVNDKTVELTVLPGSTASLSFGNDLGTATICEGGSMSLKYSATLPAGSGCTWTLSQDGGGTIASGGASTGGLQTIAIPGVSSLAPGEYTFRLSVSCTTGGCNVSDKTVVLTVIPDPVISISGATAACPGVPIELFAQASGGTGDCTIQWQRLENNEWVNIAGQNGPTVTVTPLVTTSYRATYSCTGSGCFAASNILTITIEDKTVILAADENLTIPSCTESALVLYSFQAVPCGGAFNSNSIGGQLVPLGNTPPPVSTQGLRYASVEGGGYLYEFGAVLKGGIYNLTIDDGAGGLTPLAVRITVNPTNDPSPVITFQPNIVTIPSCAESINIFGSATVATCDQNLAANRLTIINQNGQLTAPSFVDPFARYVEFPITVDQTDVNADPNFNFFTITYTDALGASTTVQPGFSARQTNAFDSPPTIVFPSNEVKLTIDACEPCINYMFSVTAIDECDGDVKPVVRLFPNSQGGGVVLNPMPNTNQYSFCYPEGVHRVEISAKDKAGNERKESFKLTVEKDPFKLPNIGCNDQVNITLEKDCQKIITPDMVTEGNFGTCYPYREEDFTVIVYDGIYKDKYGKPSEPNNIVEKCGIFNYVVMWGPKSDEYCWGKVNIEDKTPPVVHCPKDVYGLVKSPGSELVVDGVGYQYRPGTAWDLSCGPDASAEAENESEEFHRQCYPFCGGREGIDFNWLVCTDLDKVLNVSKSWSDDKYPYFTGKATPWDCSATELVSVKDQLHTVDCDGYPIYRYGREVTEIITRTFTYRDEKGNVGSCSQRIYFFRPQIDLPVCKLELDQCKYPDVTAANSKSKVDPVATKSAPSYVNAVCQRIYITDHTCKLTLTYEDQVLPGPDYCGVKIIRIWTLLDWCWKPTNCDLFRVPEGCKSALSEVSNKKRTYEQHIVIGDKIPPVLACPEVKWPNGTVTTTQEFSTGPFNCTAVVNPLPPVVKNDECKGWDWEFELYGDITDPKTGLIKKDQLIAMSNGKVVYGIAPGVYKIKYLVADKCGNESYIWCNIEVKDKIAPVAICDDQLNVSIGGANTTAEGLARVTAADVDEGSWDNCELAYVEVRREIEATCLEIYADLVNGLVWPTDYDPKPQADGSTLYLAKKDAPKNNVKKGDTLIVKLADGTYFSWWAPVIYFTCCDISTDASDKLTVELRATDKAGNTNVCWQDILIEDKLPPVCEVHDREILCTEIDFNAADAVADPSLLHARFGKPSDVVTLLDNCGAEITEVVSWKPGNCGTGVIERKYTVTDASGRSVVCTQKITILEVNDYNIKFPADVSSAECGVELEDDITVSTDACDILAVNRDTARFEADGNSNACYKLLITYRVINWCEYDGETLQPTVIPRDIDNDNDLEECTWLEAQYETGKFLNDNYKLCVGSWPSGGAFVVKVFAADAAKKRKTLPEKILVRATCSDGNTHVGPLVYRYNPTTKCYEIYCYDERPVSTICANLNYQSSCWTPGYYEYTQIVKVYDNTAPTITVENESLEFCAYGTPPNDCGGQVDIVFTVDDECTPDLVKVRNVRLDVNNGGNPQDLTGQLYTVTNVSGNTYRISGKLPVGKHTFIVSALDGCGNLDGLRIPFEVKDCKSPAPICIQTLSVDLMPVDANSDGSIDGGMNTVWATDYIASPIDDCSPFNIPSKVKYFVFKDSELPEGPDAVTLADLTDAHASVVFTCEEENESVLTYVYALDAAGNFDYCMVMTVVKAGISPSPCGTSNSGNGQIAGLIADESLHAVSGVNVKLSGQASMNYVTNNNGDYAFKGLVTGYDYSVTPSLDREYLNGVSTFDLVLISKHILGVKPLDSPYKMIAADVNNSKSITTLDLIGLRKLILSVETKFSNNTSWRFVRADYVFPNKANPWAAAFPEVLNINNLTGNIKGDFVAVKVGDVNGNAVANGLMSTEVRGVAGVFELKTNDVELTAGDEYTITITSDQLASIQGYQGTLTFDRNVVELVDLQYGVAKEENFGIFAAEGAITMSWNANSEQRTANSDLFSLVLRARGNARLSEVLGVSSSLTRAEAYNTADGVLDVALNFGQGVVAKAGFELYQNTPNPFKGQTVIGFNLPASTTATIKVNDVTGRTVKVITGQYNRGYNEIRLNSAELSATGVLYYTVETAEFTATRKMVIIE